LSGRILRANEDWGWKKNSETDQLVDDLCGLENRLTSAKQDLITKFELGLDWLEETELRLPPGALSARFKGAPPFEWLVGHFLPEVFQVCFGRKATLRRPPPKNAPDGPFVKFAEQVLTEFSIKVAGRPYQRESIAKALTEGRKKRRK
jgi:hypothetical protein